MSTKAALPPPEMARLAVPHLASRRGYARKFQDSAFWQPYIDEVLRRHGLPADRAILGTGGSFPTFLVGARVVKFFGRRFDGAECFSVERSLYTHVLPHTHVSVPVHVAHGHLFQTGWRWPYIVTTRLSGTSWREASDAADWKRGVAAELGAAMRSVHQLGCPDEPVWRRDTIGELRATSAARHRRRRTLPDPLLDQIDAYLALPSPMRQLVHGDLHGDHIFVSQGRLVGIIDWGDAVCGDPFYELPALFFGAFGGDKALLRAFLDAYGWSVSPDFAHRAMTMTLVHEFNPLGDHLPPLEHVRSLHDLAEMLWQV